jgi:hypothetical protein
LKLSELVVVVVLVHHLRLQLSPKVVVVAVAVHGHAVFLLRQIFPQQRQSRLVQVEHLVPKVLLVQLVVTVESVVIPHLVRS